MRNGVALSPAASRLARGIGLPYVRGVAEAHGGSVGVDSAVERGTTFLIDVPVDARSFMSVPTTE